MTDSGIDIVIDFMDMTDAGRLWATRRDVRTDIELTVGHHVIVGDDGADPRVARVEDVDEDGHVSLIVLPGSVESHRELLSRA